MLKGCGRRMTYVLFCTHDINTNHPQADHFIAPFPDSLQFSKRDRQEPKKGGELLRGGGAEPDNG